MNLVNDLHHFHFHNLCRLRWHRTGQTCADAVRPKHPVYFNTTSLMTISISADENHSLQTS
jgi:hypothetical protein